MLTLTFRQIAVWTYTQLRPISEDGGPEVSEWNEIMEPYLGMNWLDTPWLYAEFYAYRRLMEAFSFFKTGKFIFSGHKFQALCFIIVRCC